MGNGNEIPGSLDEESLIYRQIDRINRFVARDMEGINFEKIAGISTVLNDNVNYLEAMLSPIIDEEYDEEMEKLNNELKDGKIVEADFANEKLKELIKLMHREGIFFDRGIDIILQEPKTPPFEEED